MDKEQIKAIAEKADDYADDYLQSKGEFHPNWHDVRDEYSANAAIESYKAELLKEVGEPVLYAEFAEDGGWLGDASEYADHLEEPHALFTSDQVAAAIIKATKPMEDQLAAAQEANEHWQRATAENENKWIEANDKLAKAEQRVAEACALQVATETKFHWLDAARVAKEIRSGEWRKFVKEVR